VIRSASTSRSRSHTDPVGVNANRRPTGRVGEFEVKISTIGREPTRIGCADIERCLALESAGVTIVHAKVIGSGLNAEFWT
jgi:hypothetical protein